MSPEDKAAARLIFEGKDSDTKACHFCAGLHASVAGLTPGNQPCPRVRKLEFHLGGEVASVEFWPPGRWERDVLFPAEVYDDEEETTDGSESEDR